MAEGNRGLAGPPATPEVEATPRDTLVGRGQLHLEG